MDPTYLENVEEDDPSTPGYSDDPSIEQDSIYREIT